jgi:hypothetical protein
MRQFQLSLLNPFEVFNPLKGDELRGWQLPVCCTVRGLSPPSIKRRACATWPGVRIGLRPSLTPRRFAALRPARVRSTIRARSNSASAPIMCSTKRPPAFVVSIGSERDWKPTPRSPNSATAWTKVGQGPAEPVELPHNQCVTPLKRPHGAIEARARDGAAAHPLVGEHFPAPRLFERIALQREGLVIGRNASVADSHKVLWN